MKTNVKMNDGALMKSIAVGVLVAILVIFSVAGCSVVGPGERGVRVTMGKASNEIKESGPYLVVPFVSSIRKISIQTLKSDVKGAAASSNMQEVTTHVAVNWSVDPTQIVQIVKDFGDEENLLARVVEPAVQEVLKQATAKKTADEVLTKRAELKSEIDTELASRLKKYGIIVRDVSIVDIHFSEEFTKSIERKQVAEQESQRAEYDAIRASKEADAVVNKAKGDAEAQKLLKVTISEELLRLRAIEKWNGELPQVVGQGTIPMIDLKQKAK